MKHEEMQFLTYERIRRSGLTNMFDVTTICTLSGGVLGKEDCLYIMKNYEKLADKYLEQEEN